MQPIRIGVVGIGKIARDQHIPSLTANPSFQFVAAVSRNARVAGVPNYHGIDAMLAELSDLDAVAICTPPQFHYKAAKLALALGKHVLLEKPPCTSLAQLSHLQTLAMSANRTLYQTWHSQHAHGVAPAARLLTQRKLLKARVTWKEDVRKWHPGQTWIWQAGGFGVLDPGINAFSILNRIIPEPIFPMSATFFVPSDCDSPIAANIELTSDSGVQIDVELDFRHTGTQTWDIDLETDQGPIKLSAGGGALSVGGEAVPAASGGLGSEYDSIYRCFAQLIESKQSDVDARPLTLVADVCLIARHVTVEPFEAKRV